MGFFSRLFDTEGFPPRWRCGAAWAEDPALGWMHVVSDVVTWLAYLLIPVVLAYFVLKRKDIVFPKLFWLFCVFILACGTVHLIEAVIFWVPLYRLSALAKMATAIASMATVVALFRVAPAAVALPELFKEHQRLTVVADLSQQIIEGLPCGVLLVTQDGLIQSANMAACQMFGYERSELVGQPVETLVPDRISGDHNKLREAYFQDPQSRSMGEGRDLFGKRRDGSNLPVEIGLSPITTTDGPCVLASIIDTTKRKEHEDAMLWHTHELEGLNTRLGQSNEELEQFAYIASHDLRSPLRGIANISAFLREDEAENLSAASRAYLDKLDTRVQRMETLLDDLLAYSRIGRRKDKAETVDVAKLVDEVVEMLAPPEGFEVVAASGLPAFRTFRFPLRQVFQNLIGNAIKHHDRAAGRVEVSAHEEVGFFRFTVSDDGPGIEPQHAERIFRMFGKLKPTDGDRTSGMGLALIRRVVRQQGGSISLRPGDGRGAEFEFLWPIDPPTRESSDGE